MAAVMAVASTAVKAQSLTLPMHKRAAQSVVMKPQAKAIITMPGVKSSFRPVKGLALDMKGGLVKGGQRKALARATMQRLKARAMKAREAEDETTWGPAKDTSYMINEDGDGWDFDSQNTYQYNSDGLVGTIYTLTNETNDNGVTSKSYTRTDMTYTDDGRTLDQTLYTSLDGKEYTAYQRLSRTYDEVMPSFYTFMGYYMWDELQGVWEMSDQANKYSYTRDADDNITSALIAAPYQGEWENVRRVTNTINPATKQIDSFKYEAYGYDDDMNLSWSEDQYFTGIKWVETNGQVASEYEEDPSKNWMNDGNVLQSATLSATGAGGQVTGTGAISLTYDADGGYAETKTYIYQDEYDGQQYTLDCKDLYTVTMLDDNGSFEIEYQSWGDYDGDGTFTDDELDYHQIEVVVYDDNENLVGDLGYDMPEEEGGDEGWDDYSAGAAVAKVKAAAVVDDDDVTPISDTDPIDATQAMTYKGLELVQGGMNVMKYDAEHNGAVKQQVSYDFDGVGSFLPQNKIVVDEYADLEAAGIKDVPSADAAAGAAVYTLEGVKVGSSLNEAPHGTYIVKNGASVKKVVKK